jgi:hypothetical protein
MEKGHFSLFSSWHSHSFHFSIVDGLWTKTFSTLEDRASTTSKDQQKKGLPEIDSSTALEIENDDRSLCGA